MLMVPCSTATLSEQRCLAAIQSAAFQRSQPQAHSETAGCRLAAPAVPQLAARPACRRARKMPAGKSRGAGRVHSGIPCAPCAPCCCKESLRGLTPVDPTSCSTGRPWARLSGAEARFRVLPGVGWTPFDVMTRVGGLELPKGGR